MYYSIFPKDSALSLSLSRRPLTRNILSNMNIENIPELSGSPAHGDQQDLVDKGIVEYPGNSKQGDSVQDNSDQKQCRQGQECGVVLDVKQLNEVAIHDFHDDSADQQLECLNMSEAAPAEEEQAVPILSRIRESFTWEKFFYAFFLGLLPTGWDVATDIHFGLAQEEEGELTTAGFCYMFICFPVIFTFFFPALGTWMHREWSKVTKTTLLSFVYLITFCLLCIAIDSALLFAFVNHPTIFKYPALASSLFTLSVKVVALFVHTPEVAKFSLKISSAESSYEAPAQLLFLLHAWVSGGQVYISTMVSSVLVIAKVGAENILTKGEEDKMKDKSFLEKVALLARFMPLTALTAVFRIGSATAFHYHPRLLLPPTPSTAIILSLVYSLINLTLLLILLTTLRTWVARLRQLNLVELALGIANEFTTVSVWGSLGREGSKGLQLGIATYHLLLNCGYLSWQLTVAANTKQTLGVRDEIKFHSDA